MSAGNKTAPKPTPAPPAAPVTLEALAKQGAMVALPANVLVRAINEAMGVTGMPDGWSVARWVAFWQGELPATCRPVATGGDAAEE